MTIAEQFRKIESIARQAAEQCEAKTAEVLEVATWTLEIQQAAVQIKPEDVQS